MVVAGFGDVAVELAARIGDGFRGHAPNREVIDSYLDAGYDHVYLHRVGDDQRGFMRFWSNQLGPLIRKLASTA